MQCRAVRRLENTFHLPKQISDRAENKRLAHKPNRRMTETQAKKSKSLKYEEITFKADGRGNFTPLRLCCG